MNVTYLFIYLFAILKPLETPPRIHNLCTFKLFWTLSRMGSTPS